MEARMDQFPRTTVGGVSLPRLIAGTNWFLGYSHTSLAKDRFIKDLQTRHKIRDVLIAFLENGVDAIMGPPSELLEEAILDAEDHTGRAMTRILTPIFNITPGGAAESEPEVMLIVVEAGRLSACHAIASHYFSRSQHKIRYLDHYTQMIRTRGMLPGLSTHMPETVVYADQNGADIETYIQIYNAAGFLMQVEADWIMRIIHNASKPVMTIKPLAAGKLLPVVGLAFVWNTIRPQDMVVIGTTTPEEVREVIDISLSLLSHELPDFELQKTRSKKSLE
jgi:hypothetical protein